MLFRKLSLKAKPDGLRPSNLVIFFLIKCTIIQNFYVQTLYVGADPTGQPVRSLDSWFVNQSPVVDLVMNVSWMQPAMLHLMDRNRVGTQRVRLPPILDMKWDASLHLSFMNIMPPTSLMRGTPAFLRVKTGASCLPYELSTLCRKHVACIPNEWSF